MSPRRLAKKFLRRIFFSTAFRRLVGYTKKVALPGFENIPIFYVADFFFTGIQRGRITTRAKALAFSFFLALFPAIIFLFSLIPYIPVENFQDEVLALIRGALPSNAYESVKSTIEDIVKIPRGGLLSLGFVAALYFTTNGFMTLMRGFNSSYHIAETRSVFRQRMAAIVLTLIISVLVLVSTGLIIFSEAATKYLVSQNILKSKTQVALIILGKWSVAVGLLFMAVSFIYYYAPSSHKRWKFVSAGSTFATICGVVVSTGFAFFVNNFNQYNRIYGSIGTLIVIMLWLYFNSLILILGFELNASIHNAKRMKGAGKIVELES